SMQCLLKILQFLGGLVNESPTDPVGFLKAFVDGLKALEECTNMVLPTGLLCFVKDLLALIARMILFAVAALERMLNILSGLESQIADAQASGNAELIAALRSAKENAKNAAAGTMQALQPIGTLLVLA